MPETFRPNAIKAIVFDMGGVIVLDAPRYFLSELSVREDIDVEELVKIWRKYSPSLMAGKITENEFWLKFIDELNLPVPQEELLARFKKELRLFLLPDKDFLAYLSELKNMVNHDRPKEPIKFAILSNNAREWRDALNEQYALGQLFDVEVYSFDDGVAKPDPAIFKRVSDKLKADSDEILYVDNKAKNVNAARAQGMYALLFTTPEDFKKEMVELKMAKSLEKR